MAYTILHNDEFDYAKRDSRLAAYGGVVLQRFEFAKFVSSSGNPQNDNSPKSR